MVDMPLNQTNPTHQPSLLFEVPDYTKLLRKQEMMIADILIIIFDKEDWKYGDCFSAIQC